MAYSDRTSGNRQKLEYRDFHTDIRKNFFTLSVTEHWNKLLREVEESAPLEISRIHLNALLCKLF